MDLTDPKQLKALLVAVMVLAILFASVLTVLFVPDEDPETADEEPEEEETAEEDGGGGVCIIVAGVFVMLFAGLLAASYFRRSSGAMNFEKPHLVLRECRMTPEVPVVGEETELVLVLGNEGAGIEAWEHELRVSVFDVLELIDELDLSELSFPRGSDIELPAIIWVPKEAGTRRLSPTIEIDGETVYTHGFTIEVAEE